jgi:flagellar M-ring protein FliF
MALVKTEDITLQARGFNGLSLFRQLGLMIGLAASVAVGVAAALWSQGPSYQLLYSNLSQEDAGAITSSLESSGIKYQVSEDSTVIMVPADQVHSARLKLASQGLPKGGGAGFELLEKNSGFGVSQFMENARYQRALEGELARTIASIQSVQSARVHLAIPPQTAFVRDRKKPTASVTINLLPGRNLEGDEAAAIAHMVAASIPNLDADQVTIIDQKGRMLTSPGSSSDMQLSSTQFEYRKRLEENYKKRIEDILSPVVGIGGVKAQVAADIDFTVTEQTQESFNPDMPAIRSEQTIEEKTAGGQPAGGVPGSLSNQPPAGAPIENTAAEPSGSSTRRSTRNYELDKTISHTRVGSGSIKRLSVAVVVDNKQEVNEDGEVTRTPFSEDEITRFTNLVKEAIGFNIQRGDSVNVINAAFSVPPEPEPLPEPSFFDSPTLWSTLKQILVGGFVLFLVFGVLRPVLRELVVKGKSMPTPEMLANMQDQLALSGQGGRQQGSGYENNLNTARTLVSQDPKRVAQVVNNWVANDA